MKRLNFLSEGFIYICIYIYWMAEKRRPVAALFNISLYDANAGGCIVLKRQNFLFVYYFFR